MTGHLIDIDGAPPVELTRAHVAAAAMALALIGTELPPLQRYAKRKEYVDALAADLPTRVRIWADTPGGDRIVHSHVLEASAMAEAWRIYYESPAGAVAA